MSEPTDAQLWRRRRRRMIAMCFATGLFNAPPERTLCRTSSLTGAAWIREILDGHPTRIHEHFRMDRNSFLGIASLLKEGKYYKESKRDRIGIFEALGMFLLIVSHKTTHRIVAERFQHSADTVNRKMRKVGRAFCALAPRVIGRLPSNGCHPKIRYDSKLYPWFKGCIGALDGTFIPAFVPKWQHDAFRTRKSTICQNVLAACDHDMRFVHLHCGWEGSANDARVFRDAYTTESASFPHPELGEFYLVDSAFTNMPGFMAPFKHQRYHIDDWDDTAQERNKNELFNHGHSRLRNVVERLFGKWKKVFAFLKGPMNNFRFTNQVNMVMSCAVIHNLMISQIGTEAYEQMNDNIPNELETENVTSNTLPHVGNFMPINATPAEIQEWNDFRETMADEMWAARHL